MESGEEQEKIGKGKVNGQRALIFSGLLCPLYS